MLKEKIKLNSSIRKQIKLGRERKGISVKEASESINRKTSYVSGLENKHILSIKSEDLIKLFIFLFNISEDDAENKIESLLKQEDMNIEEETIIIDDEDNMESKLEIDNIKDYHKENFDNDEKFKKMLLLTNKIIKAYYQKRPKDAERMLFAFVRSCKFDLGFISAIISIPFFTLEKLSHDERQKVYDEIIEIFEKYYYEIKNKNNDEE
ncbi:MAG: hypothetical protein PHY44_01710 [Lachnospiraceae bacterium]|nr:hypothetical protein [Lachnospiraceae bacterium]